MPDVLFSRDVAAELGCSLRTFQRNRRKLRQQGFPEPFAKHPNRWDGEAVRAWRRQQCAPAGTGANDTTAVGYAQTLKDRAANL